MSGFGLKFDYFHKILLNAFIVVDGRVFDKKGAPITPPLASICRDIDLDSCGSMISDLCRADFLTKTKNKNGKTLYVVNYKNIDPEWLLITKEEYLENHKGRSWSEAEKKRKTNEDYNKKYWEEQRQEEARASALKQNEIRLKREKEVKTYIEEQEKESIYYFNTYTDDNGLVYLKDLLNKQNFTTEQKLRAISGIASFGCDVFFLEDGSPIYKGDYIDDAGRWFGYFIESFVLACMEMELVHPNILNSIKYFSKHIKNPLAYELSNYWNFNLNRKEGKIEPFQTIRIFFYKAIIRGDWEFYNCLNEYKQKEKEAQEEIKTKEEKTAPGEPNIYNFADYKKKIS